MGTSILTRLKFLRGCTLDRFPHISSPGEDARFFVWRPSRWFNWIFDVAKYDRLSNNFTFGRGGHQGARGHESGAVATG